jgi:hypothetical protein
VYTNIAVHLFGTPESEMQEYEPSEAGIREYLTDLAGRLNGIALIAGKLERGGWSLKVVGNSLEASHPQVTSVEGAVELVRRLGIDPDDITDVAEWGEAGERITPV